MSLQKGHLGRFLEVFLKEEFFLISRSNWAIAVSGGADSLALFYLLLEYRDYFYPDIHLHVLHFNHCLRKESQEEHDFVQKISSQYRNVTFFSKKWEFPATTNILERARDARMQFFMAYCQKNRIYCLFLGHHGDDQCETFFMNLVRGSGIEGLKGMKKISFLQNIAILRPFLDFFKKDFLYFLESLGVEWREDLTNYNEKYFRPRVRNFLQGETFEFKEKIVSTMTLLGKSSDIIRRHVLELYDRLVVVVRYFGYGYCDAREFSCLSLMEQRLLLRYIFDLWGAKTFYGSFEILKKCLQGLQKGKTYTVGGLIIFFFNKKIFFTSELRGLKKKNIVMSGIEKIRIGMWNIENRASQTTYCISQITNKEKSELKKKLPILALSLYKNLPWIIKDRLLVSQCLEKGEKFFFPFYSGEGLFIECQPNGR